MFFCRKYRNSKSQKQQALRGCYLGPGIVIGHQRANTWVAFAGRCYLVAPEHIRGLAPDEIATATKPNVRYGLEELRKASKATDFIDTTAQDATPEDLEQALDQPAGNDHSADSAEMETEPATAPESAVPIQTLIPVPEETDAENEMAIDDVA